jgi:hypothetical protein
MDLLCLPVELVLEILSHLPVQSLHAFQRVSRYWNQVVHENESYLYRNAADVHQFLPNAETNISDLQVIPRRLRDDLRGWKDFCEPSRARNFLFLRSPFQGRLQFLTEKGWTGKGSSISMEHFSTGTSVHRIKLDERRGILIVTQRDGGLVVTDLQLDRVLWSLPKASIVDASRLSNHLEPLYNQ